MNIAQKLKDHSTEILRDRSGFSYPRRIDMERTLFLIAKDLAREVLELEIHNFGFNTRQRIEERTRQLEGPFSKHVSNAVVLAFQLKAALDALTSGEPYRTWEMAGPILSSRKDAMSTFARGLSRLATMLDELDTAERHKN
jgi:hypothetical protein